MNKQIYCNNLFKYSRFKTYNVNIGDIPLGSSNPIRIQSMTNTITSDVNATIEQCIKIFDAGGEYVRITTPSVKDAVLLSEIKEGLIKKGYNFPLIADIHFNPKAAKIAAGFVEKIRINPGNYVDKVNSGKSLYTNEEYESELLKVNENLSELISLCKEKNTALRIGSNHGSLSDRILSRYGDTPLGMVEAAMEFLRVCKVENFFNVVVSMKASNTKVMIYAYRLLVSRMMDEGMSFPLHLGVTEAGEGEDGRIRSSVGIGSLLIDGLGDTIRVSLTEAPEEEIPVAKKLVQYIETKKKHSAIEEIKGFEFNPFEYNKRKTTSVCSIGGDYVPIVMAMVNDFADNKLNELGFRFNVRDNNWVKTDLSPDYLFLENYNNGGEFPKGIQFVLNSSYWKSIDSKNNLYPYFTLTDFISASEISEELNFIEIFNRDIDSKDFEKVRGLNNVILVLRSDNTNSTIDQRAAFLKLNKKKCQLPVVIRDDYNDTVVEDLQIKSSVDFGGLFVDGFGDGLMIKCKSIASEKINSLSFGILQAAGARISKTEYISCPSCGRTMFDIQEVVAVIKARTSHLKGLKIAVMGCVVNGPGEMADADYGYVGAGKGKVNLYKAKIVVEKNVDEKIAVEKLIDIIKDNGDWA
jgi:(E)-4-hydroxy-3-methylbut-2-enyl-diphosphate synthase